MNGGIATITNADYLEAAARLLAEHGPDIKLPDLLGVIAQCPKWGNMNDLCEAGYAPSNRMDVAPR
jgi:hypothetical protein